MALSQYHDPIREALLKKGAAEIQALNSHIGAPPQAYTEEECASILRDDEELAALWQTAEGQRAQLDAYTAAQAVDEDRGE